MSYSRTGELLLWGSRLWDPRAPQQIHKFDTFGRSSRGVLHPNSIEAIFDAEVNSACNKGRRCNLTFIIMISVPGTTAAQIGKSITFGKRDAGTCNLPILKCLPYFATLGLFLQDVIQIIHALHNIRNDISVRLGPGLQVWDLRTLRLRKSAACLDGAELTFTTSGSVAYASLYGALECAEEISADTSFMKKWPPFLKCFRVVRRLCTFQWMRNHSAAFFSCKQT